MRAGLPIDKGLIYHCGRGAKLRMDNPKSGRRDFLQAAGTAFTTSLFTSRVKGANDRIAMAFIGMGRQGRMNMGKAMRQPDVAIPAVCDVYEPHLQEAVKRTGGQARAVRDFREILADKSVDAVCISTPDHWHAYMTVEACKAGKDVFVEKPACVAVEEGQKMVEAARKYNRVVTAGTIHRSGPHFQKACEIVRSGQLGKVTWVRTGGGGQTDPAGCGTPADSDPPKDLNWDMWLGPAPMRPFNKNRFGVDPHLWSTFRLFWDYAGGPLTDIGVHWIDVLHLALNEPMPSAVTAVGGRFWLEDNTETPDTLLVSLEYPQLIATFEQVSNNAFLMAEYGGGILFHGTKGTLLVTRGGYRIIPEEKSDLQAVEVAATASDMSHGADFWLDHMTNFVACIRNRARPNSDIETCYRSTAACLLGNIALRNRTRLDWDGQTLRQSEARRALVREYREPWKLVV